MSNSSIADPTQPSNSSATSSITMPPKPPSLPLTLILAATPSLGIGQAGQLPWPQLKTEMGYFARVTKRIPRPSSPSRSERKRINAVVMGRKTWESIPEKFRPLKGRLNVVITRDAGNERWKDVQTNGDGEEGPIIVGSVSSALEVLQSPARKMNVDVDRVFVIGGASIYKAALELPQTESVLLTKIRREYECDTFFPVDLDGEEGRRKGWRRRSREELERFVGEEGKGVMEEKGVEFEFCLYEKECGD